MFQVWESRENFDETNSTSPLSWFPFDALPPERDILLTIADLFIALPYDELILKESVLEQLKVAFIFLSLFEEVGNFFTILLVCFENKCHCKIALFKVRL